MSTFTPERQGYTTRISAAGPQRDVGTLLGKPEFLNRSLGWRQHLPFPFRYGGRMWNEIFVNSAGNLTFGRPEAELYPERDTWAGGTVQFVADSIASRAASGQEWMISAFWGLNGPDNRVYLRSNAREFVMTWDVKRFIRFGEGYEPLGPNVFQARLTPDGRIEFRYFKVAEKDGIVGLFLPVAGERTLLTFSPRETPPDRRVALQRVEISASDRIMKFAFTASDNILTSVPVGQLWYRIFLGVEHHKCEIGFAISTKKENAHAYLGEECAGTPGVARDGNRLTLTVNLAGLRPYLGSQLDVYADVLWDKDGNGQSRYVAGHASADASKIKDTKPVIRAGYAEGSIYELFHYPQVSKDVLPILRFIYQRQPDDDDFAIVITDFRIDDLHNHQGSTGGGYHVPIFGIGREPEGTDQGDSMGSKKLQVATGPIFLGPRFSEFLEDGASHYKNYANAVGWMAHELGHRWGIGLEFREHGHNTSLAPKDGHWDDLLNTASLYSVWKMFSDRPYSEKSQMEGRVFHELLDGNFRGEPAPWNLPTGFCPLELYAMGMLSRAEVPPTFLIRDPKPVSEFVLSGKKVMVRIEDVIEAMGPRIPAAGDAQKTFRLGMYLLHEGGRLPYPDKLRHARGIEKALIDYYLAGTGGRMHVIPK